MITFNKIFLFILLILPSLVSGMEKAQLLQLGNEAYSNGETDASIEYYLEVLKSDESSTVHFNLGNAYFKSNEFGRAIYHYEKSLILAPKKSETLNNLNLAKLALDIPQYEPDWKDNLTGTFTIKTWFWIAAMTFWTAAGLIIGPFILKNANIYTKLASAIFGLLFACSLFPITQQLSKAGIAICFTNDTPMKVTPTENSPAVSYIQSGNTATIKKKHEFYYLIKSPNGAEGWVKSSEIGKLW